MANDIGGVPLSRDLGALQSAEAAGTINPEFIPRGLGPDADIAHLILRGMNPNPSVGGPTIPIFVKHYRNQGMM